MIVDILFTTLPPALSLCFSLNSVILLLRLQSQKIVLTDPRCANLAGRMKGIYFDKTGTLTSTELAIDHVALLQAGLMERVEAASADRLDQTGRVVLAAFTLGGGEGSEAVGDPVERALQGWARGLVAGQEEGRFELVDRFHFDYVHYRSSVVVKDRRDGGYYLVSKGGVDSILVAGEQQEADSTKYTEAIQQLEIEGHYIIVVAVKKLEGYIPGKEVGVVYRRAMCGRYLSRIW